MQKEKCHIYIIHGVVGITVKEKKFYYLEQGFTKFATYTDYTSFPIKAGWFNLKCFEKNAFVAQEIAFWNLWPA